MPKENIVHFSYFLKICFNIEIYKLIGNTIVWKESPGGVLKNFTNSTGKHLWQSLFYNKAQVFSCEFCEIFKNTFFNRTPTVAVSDSLTEMKDRRWLCQAGKVNFLSQLFIQLQIWKCKLITVVALFQKRRNVTAKCTEKDNISLGF